MVFLPESPSFFLLRWESSVRRTRCQHYFLFPPFGNRSYWPLRSVRALWLVGSVGHLYTRQYLFLSPVGYVLSHFFGLLCSIICVMWDRDVYVMLYYCNESLRPLALLASVWDLVTPISPTPSQHSCQPGEPAKLYSGLLSPSTCLKRVTWVYATMAVSGDLRVVCCVLLLSCALLCDDSVCAVWCCIYI